MSERVTGRGLILHYPLVKNARDYSGMGNHGTMYGSPVFSSNFLGGCINFSSATSTYINTNNVFPLLFATSSLTISCWLNPSSSQVNYADIFGMHSGSYGIVCQQSGGSTNVYGLHATSFTLTADRWQHLVYTLYPNGNQYVYINGVLINSANAIPSYVGSNWCIGHGYDTSRCWNGKMSDYRMYNYPMTGAQVKMLQYTQDSYSAPPYDPIAPSQITDISIDTVTDHTATLHWTAPGNDATVGAALHYIIKYSTSPITDVTWATDTQYDTNSLVPKAYGQSESFIATGLEANTTYYFAIKASDVTNYGALSNVPSITTSIDTSAPLAISDLQITPDRVLQWTSPNPSSYNDAITYDIRYRTDNPIVSNNWDTAIQISGESSPKPYGGIETFDVSPIAKLPLSFFAIKSVDAANNISNISNCVTSANLLTSSSSAMSEIMTIVDDIPTLAVNPSSIVDSYNSTEYTYSEYVDANSISDSLSGTEENRGRDLPNSISFSDSSSTAEITPSRVVSDGIGVSESLYTDSQYSVIKILSTVTFPDTQVGNSSSNSLITIRNDGTVACLVTPRFITGISFKINTAPFVLGIGASATVSVYTKPYSIGKNEDIFLVDTDYGYSDILSVSSIGTSANDCVAIIYPSVTTGIDTTSFIQLTTTDSVGVRQTGFNIFINSYQVIKDGSFTSGWSGNITYSNYNYNIIINPPVSWGYNTNIYLEVYSTTLARLYGYSSFTFTTIDLPKQQWDSQTDFVSNINLNSSPDYSFDSISDGLAIMDTSVDTNSNVVMDIGVIPKQTITSIGTVIVKPFYIPSEGDFIAYGNHYDGTYTSTSKEIWKYNILTGVYEIYQTLPIAYAIDGIDFIVIDGSYYLAYSCYRGSTYDAYNYIYKWSTTYKNFVLLQSFPITGGGNTTFFTVGTSVYLLSSSYYSQTSTFTTTSYIHKFNPSTGLFEQLQSIPSLGAYHSSVFSIPISGVATTLLALPSYNDSATAQLCNIYKWGNVTYTKLLLPFNTNTSDTTGKTVTNSNVTISSTQSKFGGFSAYFNGNSQLTLPSSTDFSFGSSNFTIDFWAYTPSAQGSQAIIMSNYLSGGGWTTGCWTIQRKASSDTWTFYLYSYSASAPMLISTTASNLSAWTHVAIVRNVNTWTMYINGIAESIVTSAVSFNDGTSMPIYVGGMNTYYLTGYLDDVRITKDKAIWTTNFTSPTTAATIDTNTSLSQFDIGTPYQSISLVGTLGMDTYVASNGAVFMYTAAYHNGTVFDITSKMYKWDTNTNKFVFLMDFTSLGGSIKGLFFETNNTLYFIATCYNRSGSFNSTNQIYKWDGTTFVTTGNTLSETGCYDLAVSTIKTSRNPSDLYLYTANYCTATPAYTNVPHPIYKLTPMKSNILVSEGGRLYLNSPAATTEYSVYSNTIDLSKKLILSTIDWESTVSVNETVRFQVAVRDTDSTNIGDWTFVGYDGTASTYFDSTHKDLSSLSGRYVRYKVFIKSFSVQATTEVYRIFIYAYSYWRAKYNLYHKKQLKQIKIDKLINTPGVTYRCRVRISNKMANINSASWSSWYTATDMGDYCIVDLSNAYLLCTAYEVDVEAKVGTIVQNSDTFDTSIFLSNIASEMDWYSEYPLIGSTEVMSELEWGGADYMGWALITDTNLNTAADFTIVNLNGNTDKYYRIFLNGTLGVTGIDVGIGVRPNNDTTAANYGSGAETGGGNSSNWGSSALFPLGRTGWSQSGDIMCSAIISAQTGTKRVGHSSATFMAANGSMFINALGNVWKNTTTNITSLTITFNGSPSFTGNIKVFAMRT